MFEDLVKKKTIPEKVAEDISDVQPMNDAPGELTKFIFSYMFEDIIQKKEKEKTLFRTCISCGKPVKDGEKCGFCNVRDKDKVRDTEDGL